jgi:hypothetical protein
MSSLHLSPPPPLRARLPHFVSPLVRLGPFEVRELLCMPVLRLAGAAGPIARGYL